MPDVATPAPTPTPVNTPTLEAEKDAPVLVGEELGDHARIWREYDRVAKVDDDERIRNWNRGLDNLALFAGIFSAVTTSFIVQLQNDTRPDYAELTFRVLNATAAGQPFAQEAFVIDSAVRTTNCLWISSLMLSLTAALIAIMGKDRIGMYSARPGCNQRQWAEMRTYRLLCVQRWYMPGVIASAPVLLHISLVLFAAGLVLFVSPDPVAQRLALSLSLSTGGLYCVTMVSGIVFSSSPFKSPATQAFRGAIFALHVILRRGISALLVLMANIHFRQLPRTSPRWVDATRFGIQLLPTYIISLDQTTHGRLWSRWTLRGFLLPRNGLHGGESLADRLKGLARLIWTDQAAPLRSLSRRVCAFRALLWGKLCEFARQLQSLNFASYTQALRLYLSDTMLSSRWTAVSSTPSPKLVAESVSLLNATSPTPEILQVTMIALGDMAIGRDVGRLVSLDLNIRLRAEIERNWRAADMNTFARYLLTDCHLGRKRVIRLQEIATELTMARNNVSRRSETVFFAFARGNPLPLSVHDVDLFCPEMSAHPRAMRYLLPHIRHGSQSPPNLKALVLLASRCYMRGDDSFDLKETLLSSLGARLAREFEAAVQTTFSGESGLIELLVFLVEKQICSPGIGHALIMRLLESGLTFQDSVWFVRALGPFKPGVDIAWPKLPWTTTALFNLGRSLPLLQYHLYRWNTMHTPPTAAYGHFEYSLARIVIEILSEPNLTLAQVSAFKRDGKLYPLLELGLRCLHTQLCHPRSLQKPEAKSDLIRLILEKTVLNSQLNEDRYLNPVKPSERCIINILTSIARHLLRMFERSDTFAQAAHLFPLFVSSQTTGKNGEAVVWDLRDYFLWALTHLMSEINTGSGAAFGRLIAAIRALRPFCKAREDLRAAWGRTGIPVHPDPFFSDVYQNCDIGEFFALIDTTKVKDALEVGGSPSVGTERMVDDGPLDYVARMWRDASMC